MIAWSSEAAADRSPARGQINAPRAAGLLRHVQGLRAVAVLAVMAYHAGLPLPGGFVGVDIFFVISGYIITTALVREFQATGHISLRHFYWRRFRRLTPALVVTVCATVVLTVLLLSPLGQQQSTWKTGVASLALAANWMLARESGNYFGPIAEANAMTHTWSLSVEEQFYVVFPMLILVAALVWRRLPRAGVWVAVGGLATLGVLSFLAIGGLPGLVPASFPLGFYGPVTRAWEFLAGVLLALGGGRIRPLSSVAASVASGLGLALLVASFGWIDGQTAFPGMATLAPVAGTVLLLWGTSGDDRVAKRILSLRAMVKVGDWSYSLYLWHWPLIVIATSLLPFWPPAATVAALLSVPLAVASYCYVEEPFRRVNATSVRMVVRHVARLMVPALVVLSLTGVWSHVSYPRLLGEGRWMLSAINSSDAADLTTETSSPVETCQWPEIAALIGTQGQCAGPVDPKVLLVGDSHAGHLRAGIEKQVGADRLSTWSYHASPALFGGTEGIQTVVQEARELDELEVVIVGRRLHRSADGLAQNDPSHLKLLLDGLTATGAKVMIFDDVPMWPVDVSSCLWGRAPVLPGRVCEGPRNRFEEAYQLIDPQLDRLVTETGVHRVHSYWVACDEKVCRRADENGLWYYDQGHLTDRGSIRMLNELVRVDAVLGQALTAAGAS